ncbi:MAG TPA: hypothetical protein VI685_03740, partial [Candidatus Angelobacter sp.]
ALLASTVVLNLFGDRWSYQQVDGYLWVILGCVMSGQHSEEAHNAEAAEDPEQLPAQDGPQFSPA